MRDQRYYQRLNQIRVKYGYSNDNAPEQSIRQIPAKRESIPVTSAQTSRHGYLNNYDLPLRPAQNQLNIARTFQTKRAQYNNSTPPVAYGQNDIGIERSQWEKQVHKETIPKHQFEKRYPQKMTAPPYQASQNHVSDHEKGGFSEYNSPIKMLNEISKQNTPRGTPLYEKSPAVIAMKTNKDSYKSQNHSFTDRGNPRGDNLKQVGLNKMNNRPVLTPAERCRTPTPHQPNQPKTCPQDTSEQQSHEFINKYNSSLSSIDKIQQRIQAVLNKTKK